MLSISAPADEVGMAVLAAGARTAGQALGGEGEGVGLVVRQLAADARERLGGGEEDTTLLVTGDVKGTEFVITLHDFGSPVSGPPEGVQALLDAGVATAADAQTDGKGNRTTVRFPLPSHHRIVDTQELEVVPDDAEPSKEEVTYRELRPSDAQELTRALYRCYGWSYPNQTLYYPDRIAASLEDGTRIGEVAVTASGEVASHWGAVFLSPNVVETGGTITDPRFRRRGIAKALGDRLLDRLRGMEVVGRVREPVMTHPATQQIAIDEGATIIGAYINMTHPIQQIGITDGVESVRGSLSVAYSALKPLGPATMWIPAPYEPMVAKVLGASSWPRELEGMRRDAQAPNDSVMSTSFNSDNRMGVINVAVVGMDLVDEIQTSLHQLQRSGAEYVQVMLPANQPQLASLGAGLTELGLGYASLIPAYRPGDDAGDVLITQWVADTDIDSSGWVFANDQVRDLVLSVVEQVTAAGRTTAQRQRRAAHRAQLFAALEN